jgi:hypothetical protein
MQVFDSLEIALIDLEYAAADCSYYGASASDPSERANSEALRAEIMSAKQKVQLALDAWGPRRYRTGASLQAALNPGL